MQGMCLDFQHMSNMCWTALFSAKQVHAICAFIVVSVLDKGRTRESPARFWKTDFIQVLQRLGLIMHRCSPLMV
jgi:hypothetical protein